MLKKLLIKTIVALGLMGGSTISEELSGKKAERVIINGEVLHTRVVGYAPDTLYDMLIVHNNKLYNCFSVVIVSDPENFLNHRCSFFWRYKSND
tara:strand:+ start:117 stop:398 length:282 start_codon:yes stop_codon:yes gene_type:complete